MKEKRSVLSGLLLRLRREFNVSAAELDYHDDPERALLGFAHISNDGRYSDETLMSLLTHIQGSRHYYVEGHDLTII